MGMERLKIQNAIGNQALGCGMFAAVRILIACLLVVWAVVPTSVSGQTNFRTNVGVPALPVLASAPAVTTVGAAYINSGDNKVYWYDGSAWQPLCGSSSGTITSPTGQVWMDRNLGARRAATSSTDYLAYGSLFQWCRAPDGHQEVAWQNTTTGIPYYPATNLLSSTPNPGNSYFIYNTTSPYDWITTQQVDGRLWWNGSKAGSNNPCPSGYHVPTYAELNAELTYITNTATAYTYLKLPLAGYRNYPTADLINASIDGRYWTSTNNGVGSWRLLLTSTTASMGYSARGMGESVRCIKD